MAAFTADALGSAAHVNMATHLSGPLRAGALEAELKIANGVATCARATREPLVVVAPLSVVEAELRVEAKLTAGGHEEALETIVFAPFTEDAAFLPLCRPPAGGPFSVTLTVTRGAEPVAAGSVVQVRLIEGVLGGVVFLLGAEKARLRRQCRHLTAIRTLQAARGGALDRHGAELDVPRFADRLVFRDGAITGEPEREPDHEYRRRLAIYKPWALRSRRGVQARLTRDVIAPASFSIDDGGTELAVALRLIAADDDSLKPRFLTHVRDFHLLWPQDTAAAGRVHGKRFVPAARRRADEALRAAVRRHFGFSDDAAVDAALAPMLAAALARAGRCRAALGATTPWPLLRAQAAAGSRYELGLGADLAPLSKAEAAKLAEAATAWTPNGDDPELDALIASLRPDDDPDASWLLRPCGLRTVHRTAQDRLYVSHLPAFGLTITAPDHVGSGVPTGVAATLHGRGDPGPNAVLVDALARAATGWAAAGQPSWTVVTEADPWAVAPRLPENARVLSALRAAGLPAIANQPQVVARLKTLEPELVATIALPTALCRALWSGDPGTVEPLRTLQRLLRAEFVNAALPLAVSEQRTLLVLAVTRLPEAGKNLSARLSTGIRWSAETVGGAGGAVAPLGSRSTFTAGGPGLTAIVVLAFARSGRPAPFAYRVGLPGEARLDLLRYEFLMNALAHLTPAAIGVDTSVIRRAHVDLDGDGDAEALSASAARTYRAYRPHTARITGDVFGGGMPGLTVGVHSTVGVDTLLRP